MGECFWNLVDFLVFRAQLWDFDLEWGKALLPTFARAYDDSKPCIISLEHGTLRCDLVE